MGRSSWIMKLVYIPFFECGIVFFKEFKGFGLFFTLIAVISAITPLPAKLFIVNVTEHCSFGKHAEKKVLYVFASSLEPLTDLFNIKAVAIVKFILKLC